MVDLDNKDITRVADDDFFDICVCCGTYIPEGTMICQSCRSGEVICKSHECTDDPEDEGKASKRSK